MDMLVVKRPDILDHGRISCKGLYSRLLDLHKRCENNEEFAARPCPWSRRLNDVKDQSEAVEVVLSDAMTQILEPRLSELRVHEGWHTLLSDSPAILGCRELLGGSHKGKGVEAVPWTTVKGMQVVAQKRKGQGIRRDCVGSFTTPF